MIARHGRDLQNMASTSLLIHCKAESPPLTEGHYRKDPISRFWVVDMIVRPLIARDLRVLTSRNAVAASSPVVTSLGNSIKGFICTAKEILLLSPPEHRYIVTNISVGTSFQPKFGNGSLHNHPSFLLCRWGWKPQLGSIPQFSR